MTCSRGVIAGLFVSTALASIFSAETAFAQEGAAAAANAKSAAASTDAQLLGDVVVTATRQADTVNRVPLSISAVTQRALDQQGIKNVNDLQRSVPALTVSGIEAGVATFSIRGIVQSGPVTATTGVYLDDIPLQKRATTGVQQNNGTPSPPLFDLERIEVLRGPQGTLYGGSSEGGTIRFIEPQPSLVRYSAQARAEVASTRYGSGSYEGGVAVGGPIIKDKLGFRGTVYDRHTGGYIDLINPYTNTIQFKDANSTEANAYRLALLWAPSENARVTLSYFNSYNKQSDSTSSSLRPINGVLTTPSYCYNVNPAVAYATSVPTVINCPATAVSGQTVNGVYKRPALSYGPYNIQPFQNFSSDPAKGRQPAKTKFAAPNLTLEYDFPKMTVKSITSYIEDLAKAHSYEAPQVSAIAGYTDRNGNPYQPGSTVAFNGTTANITSGATLFSLFPDYLGSFNSKSKRWGMTQELRFASSGDPKPLSWVGGVYFSNIRAHTAYELPENTDAFSPLLFGLPSANRYTQQVNLAPGQTCANVDFASLGVPSNTPVLNRTVNGLPVCNVGLPQRKDAILTARDERLKDIEVAGFGEINYWVSDKFKVTAGIRWSRVSYDFKQVFYGPASGFNIPTVANTGITIGSVTQSPITPKVGLQYQVNEDDMVYVSAAKGYRPGGVNVPLPDAICGAGLALIGLTVFDAPTTYGSDSVWSYEAGGKFRLFGNKLQVNASAYRIDWSNVQLNVAIPSCGPTFIQNAGTARSEGFDLSAAGRVFPGLTANINIGYDNAQYTQTATGPVPKNGSPATPVVQKGDKLPVPPLSVSAGLQYDFGLAKYRAYIRGDYQFSSRYHSGVGPGVNAYSPDNFRLPSATQVNARAGITLGAVDANVFVNNLFNSTDPLALGTGRTGCTPNTDASCTTFSANNALRTTTTFRPRTVGVQLNYKY
jgi:iron complex outermembrane receptor protein